MIHIVEGIGQAVAHDVGTFLGEVDIVGAAETIVHPGGHGVGTTHGVVDAPIGSTVGGGGGAEAVDNLGKPRIGAEAGDGVGAGAHVGRADEEDKGLWAATVQAVDLIAHLFAVVGDGFGAAEIGHRVAAELHNDETNIHKGIGLGELVGVDLGELMTGTATHGDIVYGYARTAVDKSAVEVGVARDSDMNVVGERVEAIFNSMDTFVGAFELLVGASTRGDGDRERAGSVAEDEFCTVEREEPAVARAMDAGLDGRGGRAVDMKILHHRAIVSIPHNRIHKGGGHRYPHLSAYFSAQPCQICSQESIKTGHADKDSLELSKVFYILDCLRDSLKICTQGYTPVIQVKIEHTVGKAILFCHHCA